MGSNLVIVAIPDEDDRAYKLSSEKIPHLTLMFLGDSDKVQNIDKIVQFVEHAASQTLKRFYLPVDRRDKIGDNDADVLLFKVRKRYDGQALRDFRTALLQDPNIKTAYDSAEQHEGPWVPHLTMGYPESPAKKDESDNEFGFYDVRFVKIAVWVDDYDGPEFLLKDWDDEEDLHGSVYDTPLAAWSGMAQRGQSAVAELFDDGLEHHGVKGMKWGVRKAASKTGDHLKDANFRRKANNLDTVTQLVNEASTKTKNQDLPKINAKHKELGAKVSKTPHLVGVSRVPAQKAYRDAVRAAYLKRLHEVAETKTSSTGNKKYTIDAKSATRWKVRVKDVEHAAGDFEIELILDDDGYIKDFAMVEDSLEHSMTVAECGMTFIEGFLGDGTLAHSGVKGMKWGVRKDPPSAVAATATSRVPHGNARKTKIDTEGGENHPAHSDAIKVAEAKTKLRKSGPAALSNNELREVANRVQLEQQVKQLVQPAGKKFVNNLLRNQGTQTANSVASKQIKRKFALA